MRYASQVCGGPPWAKIYAGCKYMEEIENIANELAKKLFHSEFADIRPVSGLLANLSVYVALTSPGDTMVSLPIRYGGHVSSAGKEESGSAWMVHGLNVEDFVFDSDRMNIDPNGSLKKINQWPMKGRSRR